MAAKKRYFYDMMHSGDFGRVRLDAFSDGVFAIVITLLVIELHVPELTGPDVSHQLQEKLLELMPKFISFLVSFIYVSIYWFNHHQLFHFLKKSDRGLFWLNSLFLLFLTFIPFPTALIGSYPDEPIAVIIYGVTMMCAAISFVLMKIYMFYSGKLVDPNLPKPAPFFLIAGPLLYLVAVLLALINVLYALAIYILIPVIYFFAGGLDKN